jgi:hypothetical protein
MRRFSVPPLKPSASVKVVFDGNSLVQGIGATSTPLPVAFASLVPGVASVSNFGGSGQTWRQMNGLDGGSAADVDGAFDATKTNVLFAWETTNSVCNVGRSAVQAIQDATDYIAARRALHPGWKIILVTSIPRQVGLALNQTMATVDATFLANYRAMGADAVVDVRRPGSYFNFADYSDATFANDPSGYWFEAAGGRTHLRDPAYQLIAGWCREAFKRLRAR